jgi:hypothetical protein
MFTHHGQCRNGRSFPLLAAFLLIALFAPRSSSGQDSCSAAREIFGNGFVTGDTSGATTDGSTTCGYNASRDIWFRYVPECTGTLQLRTCGSSFDTVLSLHTACTGTNSNELACNDDSTVCGPGSRQSYIERAVIGGTSYIIRLAGYQGATGYYQLSFQVVNTSPPPPNDNCNTPTIVTDGGVYSFDTRCAFTEVASSCRPIGKDVWFQFTAPSNGTLSLDTCGSAFDTVLVVYDGAGCVGLQVACNDDGCTNYTSRLSSITVVAGRSYKIRVGGYDFGGGRISFGTGVLRVDFRCPDLTVQSVTISPNPPYAGIPATITATVANTGDADAGSFYIELYIDGQPIAPSSFPNGLAAGATASRTFEWTAPTTGCRGVTVVADDGAQVAECNENNNSRSVSPTPCWVTPVGSISAALQGLPGGNPPTVSAVSPRIALYTYPGYFPVAERVGPNANPALFNDLAIATYHLEGYSTGTFFGEEYWGETTATVSPGTTTPVTIPRRYPYISGIALVRSDGTPIGPTVVAGTTAVYARVTVTHIVPGTQFSAGRVRVLLDRSQSASYDCDSGFSSPQALPSNTPVTFLVPLCTPSATGRYYFAAEVQTTLANGSNRRTDSYNWSQAFDVVPPAPEIRVSVDGADVADGGTVDFGDTPIGQPVTKPVVVYNDGTANLTISSAPISGSGFARIGAPASTVAPGQSTGFSLQLTATASGRFFATLQIANNDANENPYDIALTGSVGCGGDDHGNTASCATPVNIGSRYDGTISPGSDQDWFSFQADAGYHHWFEVHAGPYPSLTASILTLFAPDGTTQVFMDRESGAGTLSRIDWTCSTSGRYYLRVERVGTSLGGYALSLSRSSRPVPSTKGITILAHGFDWAGAFSDPVTEYWDNDREILVPLLRAFGGGRLLVYDQNSGQFQEFHHGSADIFERYRGGGIENANGELVLVHNWTEKSNDPEAGHAEEAAEALFAALVNAGYVNLTASTSSRALHFIGHSRGTVVASETIQRLGVYGVPVHYVTFLDPHDFDQQDLGLDEEFHDPAVQVWTNVRYADNFYQTTPCSWLTIANPIGRELLHLIGTSYEHNYRLHPPLPGYSVLPGFETCEGGYPHSKVVNWYSGTIQPGSQSAQWYTDGRGDNVGFALWLQRGGYDFTNPQGIGFREARADPVSMTNVYPYPSQNDGDNDFARTDVFNGEFELPDLQDGTLAGWYYHGGGGQAPVQFDGSNHYLRILTGWSRTHNRVVVPPTAQSLLFRFWVDNPSSVASLRVSIGPYVWDFDVDQAPQWFNATASLPASLQGTVQTIEFEVTSPFGLPSVRVDDVRFACAGPTPTQPSNQAVCVGQTATFSIGAPGATGYQWQHNGVGIADGPGSLCAGGGTVSGSTTATLTITNAQVCDAGTFTCVVSNTCGSNTSGAAVLAVSGPPTNPQPPNSQAICAGQTAIFAVVAPGATAYQWRRNGAPISNGAGALCPGGGTVSGATTATLTVSNVRPCDAGQFSCTVSNDCGSINSASATLTVYTGAAITEHPSPVTACAGQTATFTISATGATGYRWFRGDSPINEGQVFCSGGGTASGATSPTLTISNAQPCDASEFWCRVFSLCGQRDSNRAQLTVNSRPTITGEPSDVTVCAGQPVSMCVAAIEATNYQWLRNGTPVPGATAPCFSTPSAQETQAGTYVCRLSNACGSVDTRPAVLTVRPLPTITQQPLNRTVCAGVDVTLCVTATGAIGYQWYHNGVQVPGALASCYVLTGVQPEQAGTYYCEVRNDWCSVSSSSVSLTVITPPTITQQPSNTAVCAGQPVSLCIAATGATSYQWYRDGLPLGPANNNPCYDIPSAQPLHAGDYYCVARNNCGPSRSTVVALSVDTEPVISQQPASTTVCAGQPVSLCVVSPNATGYQWYRDGNAIPNVTSSCFTTVAAEASDTGTYYCLVSNTCGIVQSSSAILMVNNCCGAVLYVRSDAPSGGDGCGWPSAINDLQSALDVARANPAITEIWVARGVYKPNRGVPSDRMASFRLVSNVAIYGGFVGTETRLEDRPTIPLCEPPGAPPLPPTGVSILDGDLAGNGVPDRLANRGDDTNNVVVAEGVHDAGVDGFVIRSGWTAAAPVRGAGLLHENSERAIVANCIFERNDAGDGGAVFVRGSPTFLNCVFRDNSVARRGGSVLVEGSDSSPRFLNCVFAGGYASVDGGLLAVRDGASPDIVNCTFFGGWVNGTLPSDPGGHGGAIYIGDPASAVRLDNCIVWNCGSTALGSNEAALFGPNLPTFFNRCTIQGWTGSLPGMESDGFNPLFEDSSGFAVFEGLGLVARNLKLRQESPCIDVGDNAAVTSIDLTTDICSVPRRLDVPTAPDGPYQTAPVVDRGAHEHEFQGPPCDPDVNCDGSADGFDVETMERAVGGDASEFCQGNLDFNQDGSVDGFDIESVESVVGGAPCP